MSPRPDTDGAYWEQSRTIASNGPPIAPPEPPPVRRTRQTTAKRYISAAERQAATVAKIAARVVGRCPKVELVAAALLSPTLRAAATRDGGRGSDHPDPTAGLVIEHADTGDGDYITYADYIEAVQAWLEQGKWIEDVQIRYLKEHPETTAAKTDTLKGLCTEPGCDFERVRRNLCWHHYRAALQSPMCAVSTPDVLEPAISEPSARTAVVWCHQCRVDHPVPAGEDPVAWLDWHRACEHGA